MNRFSGRKVAGEIARIDLIDHRELIHIVQEYGRLDNIGVIKSGSTQHLSGELFKLRTTTSIQHVPYKGTGPALTDLYSGQVQLLFNSALTMIPQIRGNRVRGLAVTSAVRIQPLPELPSIAEAGVPGYDVTSWYGLLAPARTPRAVIERLNAELVKTVRAPELRDRLLSEGVLPVGSSPPEFRAFIQRELTRWAKVIKDAGIVVE